MSFIPLKQVKTILDTMQEYLSRLMFLGEVRGPANNIRVTVTDATVPVSGTLTGVTTVTTLTNQTQIGGYNASMQVQNMQNIEACIGNIDNLIVN